MFLRASRFRGRDDGLVADDGAAKSMTEVRGFVLGWSLLEGTVLGL